MIFTVATPHQDHRQAQPHGLRDRYCSHQALELGDLHGPCHYNYLDRLQPQNALQSQGCDDIVKRLEIVQWLL